MINKFNVLVRYGTAHRVRVTQELVGICRIEACNFLRGEVVYTVQHIRRVDTVVVWKEKGDKVMTSGLGIWDTGIQAF